MQAPASTSSAREWRSSGSDQSNSSTCSGGRLLPVVVAEWTIGVGAALPSASSSTNAAPVRKALVGMKVVVLVLILVRGWRGESWKSRFRGVG